MLTDTVKQPRLHSTTTRLSIHLGIQPSSLWYVLYTVLYLYLHTESILFYPINHAIFKALCGLCRRGGFNVGLHLALPFFCRRRSFDIH